MLSDGPRVHLEDVVAVAVDVQLREVGVVADRRDQHLPQLAAQAHDDLLQQVVRERAGVLHAGQLHRDGAGLAGADPDREDAGAVGLLQHDDRRVRAAVEPEVRHPHLDHRVAGRVRCQGPTRPGSAAAPA